MTELGIRINKNVLAINNQVQLRQITLGASCDFVSEVALFTFKIKYPWDEAHLLQKRSVTLWIVTRVEISVDEISVCVAHLTELEHEVWELDVRFKHQICHLLLLRHLSFLSLDRLQFNCGLLLSWHLWQFRLSNQGNGRQIISQTAKDWKRLRLVKQMHRLAKHQNMFSAACTIIGCLLNVCSEVLTRLFKESNQPWHRF